MRVRIYRSNKKDRERLLGDALREGFEVHGHDIIMEESYRGPRACDLFVVQGVKSKDIIDDYAKYDKVKKKRTQWLYLDKSCFRVRGDELPLKHYRISLNAFQPLAYFMRKHHPADRWEELGIQIHPYDRSGDCVLYAGSSQKYCSFRNLGDATEYAKSIVSEIRKYTDAEIIYRPKPSWRDAQPIEGTTFSWGQKVRVMTDLARSYVLVTHGSNAALDAIVFAGKPAVVLGDGIAKPISYQHVNKYSIVSPHMEFDEYRFQWCCDVAYTQ